MFTLISEIEFDMAHFLSGYDGKCANIHGHRYKLVVKIQKEELIQEGQERGMVTDFNQVKRNLKIIQDLFDHKLVVEGNEEGKQLRDSIGGSYECFFVPYRPTAEEMSRDIFNRLTDLGLAVAEVELFETPTNRCAYSRSTGA